MNHKRPRHWTQPLLYFIGLGSLGIALQACATLEHATPNIARTTRTYYIAADEVVWDYAPSTPRNGMTGKDFSDKAAVFVQGNGSDRIGRHYWKARYREYADASFTTLKTRAPGWAHLGVLGPLLRASVGDTLKILFKNNSTQPLSIHPHGVFYEKDSEGTPYDDGTPAHQRQDDHVAPGGTYTYTWHVPERAGPGENDPSSVVWMYHSHVDEPADTNAGLMGPIIVTRRQAARADGSPKDVDREIINLFTVFDENTSLYLKRNIAAFAPQANRDDDAFIESNLMHAINGYVYGNVPEMSMDVGDRVRWYLIGMGSEVDLHTPHWHGNTVLWNRQRTDVVELLPGSMKTVDMVTDNPGMWMYHCHVNDHIEAGMMATYQVLEK